MELEFDYTVVTDMGFDAAVVAVRKATEAKGWSVLHVHDIKEILAVKGFEREPLKLIEICKGLYGSRMLEADIKISLCMPCKINVYVIDGKTFISGMRPIVLPQFFPDADLGGLPDEIDGELKEIIDKANSP